MFCWIGKVIIVKNNGTVLFGDANILPEFGENPEAEEEVDEDLDGEDVVVDEEINTNRRKSKKGKKSASAVGKKKPKKR
ncbi:hypothetical protein [Paenibacillus sp. CF384]|uniref:hypothetical protein n=1 Tax=Paenibacillus sp. CF384 TaxID=1884382 RepID=UPI00089BB35A|nr:hypothetical protein [Paenibacillus sp. CF384]SDX13552.1 hypothetical protein SAMN05518855_100988 [Paenibacillus sp. CF384]